MNASSLAPLKETTLDWFCTCYARAREGIPEDFPTPHGNLVVTTTYVDANLFHDMISGRSDTGILHLLNMTPVDWYSKLQTTVETATLVPSQRIWWWRSKWQWKMLLGLRVSGPHARRSKVP